jgi:hypothetical protein
VRFGRSIDIVAERQVIWDVLMAVEQWPEWTASTTNVDRITEGPLSVGSEVRIKQPRLAAMVWCVIELEAPARLTWRTHRGGVTTVAEHLLAPTSEGTTVTLTVDQSGVPAWLVGVITGSTTRRHLDLEAQGLKARSEAQARPAS